MKTVFPGLVFAKTDGYFKISDRIEHGVVDVEGISTPQRLGLLKQLLDSAEEEFFVVFCCRNQTVKEVVGYLEEEGIPALPFHSDLEDKKKVENLFRFRGRSHPVLVCGDSANRGLHFDFDTHVIQFESAQNAVNLLHRFGRTGRLGKKGRVTSFLETKDYDLMSSFQQRIDKAEGMTPIVSRNRAFRRTMKRDATKQALREERQEAAGRSGRKGESDSLKDLEER